VDAVTSQLTPDVVHQASSLVGESESNTRSALTAAVPSVLHGMVNMASSQEGASSLTSLIRECGYGSAVESVGSLFGGGTATNGMMASGTQLLGKLFGNNSLPVANAVAGAGGVSSASATKLLALVAPLTLGVLGKRAASQKTGLSGITSELLEQKSDIAAAAPSGITKIFGAGPTLVGSERDAERLSVSPGVIEHPSESAGYAESDVKRRGYAAEPPVLRRGGTSWLPILIIAALVALGIWLLVRGRARTANVPPTGIVRVSLPGGRSVAVPRGSIDDNVAAFLAGRTPGSLPRVFVFDHLNFESGSSQLTPDSAPTVNNLAQILIAYPNARVQLLGHTDNTGTPEANQTLSQDRANAVKEMLVNQGIAPDRITAIGFGQTRPIAPNDTEQGRAHNRRLELNVIGR
jgi:outer membrane protein OmpA-like peptidoglycan-associated protein